MTSRITIRGGDHDHVRDLAAHAPGIEVGYEAMSLQELFPRMLATRCYEVCEFSLANYLMVCGSGDRWLSALPVFPHRVFRHSMAITRKDSALTDFRDLAGRKVAVPDYSMTAAVWVRGLLRTDYGVDHRSITWVTPRKQRMPFPRGTRIEQDDADPETLLLTGAVDAMLGVPSRDAKLPPGERKLRTLLPDAEAAERDYFRRTGIFPIMHCVAFRNDVLEQHPGLPAVVARAYAEAKQRAYARRAASVLPWGTAHWEADMELFSGDPLPYGLNAVNRKVVATLAEDLIEQGFVERLPDLDALFLEHPG
jgi:4,5-dihydroxyphthalate decarboxylase